MSGNVSLAQKTLQNVGVFGAGCVKLNGPAQLQGCNLTRFVQPKAAHLAPGSTPWPCASSPGTALSLMTQSLLLAASHSFLISPVLCPPVLVIQLSGNEDSCAWKLCNPPSEAAKTGFVVACFIVGQL